MNNGWRPCTVQRHTISREKTCIASTEREKKEDVLQRHTLKMQFACINYDIQKNLCTFQIFLTCIFSSHFCFSLKAIPGQALPSAKKHEKDLSFMLVGRRRDSVPIEKGLYPRDNLSIHRCIWERLLTSGILPDVQPCTHMCQDRKQEGIHKSFPLFLYQILQQQVPSKRTNRWTEFLFHRDLWPLPPARNYFLHTPQSRTPRCMRNSIRLWILISKSSVQGRDGIYHRSQPRL